MPLATSASADHPLATMSRSLLEPVHCEPEEENLLESKVEELYQQVRTMSPRVPRKNPHDPYHEASKHASVLVSPSSEPSVASLRPVNELWNRGAQGDPSALLPVAEPGEEPLGPEQASGEVLTKGIDMSLYTTKKNVAQGLLNISLLCANCSQLKYLLFHYERHSASQPDSSTLSRLLASFDLYLAINLACLGLSIVLQVVVGIVLILNGRHNIYVYRYQRVVDSHGNIILVTVFIITIVNIFLSVFISAR